MLHRGNRGWGGGGSLLQYNHSVLNIPVGKLDLHRRPRRRPSPTPLNVAVPRATGGWKSHIIGACLSSGGCGPPMTSPSRCLTVLCMKVDCQRPQRNLKPALQTLYSHSLSLLVVWSRDRHPSLVRRLQLVAHCLTQASDHSDRLPDVFPQTQ